MTLQFVNVFIETNHYYVLLGHTSVLCYLLASVKDVFIYDFV